MKCEAVYSNSKDVKKKVGNETNPEKEPYKNLVSSALSVTCKKPVLPLNTSVPFRNLMVQSFPLSYLIVLSFFLRHFSFFFALLKELPENMSALN